MSLYSPRYITGILLSLSLAITVVTAARAGFGCCAHCGGADGCQTVCRLVCEDKKIAVTQWGCKTEEFCVPGPSQPNCQHEDFVSDQSNDPKAPCSEPKRFVWTEWIPSGHATVYTKKRLMKRTVTKTVPSFKWVVENLCPQCQANCPTTAIPPGAKVPPPPVTIVNGNAQATAVVRSTSR